MRARDVRAIVFCAVSTVVVLLGALAFTRSMLISLAITAAYAVWLLTRPRMIRVARRLRGEPDWSGYFDNDGGRITPPPAPGTAASPHRPAERR